MHRRRRLLEPLHEGVVAPFLEQQDPLELGRKPSRTNSREISARDEPGIGLDIGAVDVKRRERLCQIHLERQLRRQLLRLVREGRPRLLELRRRCVLGEREPIAGELLVEARQRLLPGRVDEERADVVQELVADRSFDGPVAQPLARLEDLLDPDVLDPRLAQPLQIAARIRKPVGMIDPKPVDQPLLRELDDLRVRRLPDLRILHPHARQLADVEEATVRPGTPVEVEELGPPERIAPERVLVAGGHVVRDDVEQDAQPCFLRRPAERPKRVLAAELLRDPRRVDHVVPVRRARTRLEGGREIEMRDAEIPEIRHEPASIVEAQLRPQLEPVRTAVVGHQAIRRRTTSERLSTGTTPRAG